MAVIPILHRVREANVAWRVVDNEAVVLQADSSAYFGLNQVGTMLWEELTGHPKSAPDLVAWARLRFLDTPASLPEEVSRFLDELVELNLVERAEGTDTATSNPVPDPGAPGEPLPWE